jgi:hypothetical protein
LVKFDLDMGRIIGLCVVLETDDADKNIYAVHKNRSEQGFVQFTKSKAANPSSHISIAMIANRAKFRNKQTPFVIG